MAGRPSLPRRRSQKVIYADTGEPRAVFQRASRSIAGPLGRTPGLECHDSRARRRRAMDGAVPWRTEPPGSLVAGRRSTHVSQTTGEVVQYTTRASRLGAWVGAIPHVRDAASSARSALEPNRHRIVRHWHLRRRAWADDWPLDILAVETLSTAITSGAQLYRGWKWWHAIFAFGRHGRGDVGVQRRSDGSFPLLGTSPHRRCCETLRGPIDPSAFSRRQSTHSRRSDPRASRVTSSRADHDRTSDDTDRATRLVDRLEAE